MGRRTAVVMLAVAAAAVVVTVAAAVAAHARYVASEPLAHPFLAGFVAATVAIVAVLGLMPESTRRLLTQTGIGLLGLAVGAAGLVSVSAEVYDPHAPTVVASGPDVRVVAWQQDVIVRQEQTLRLRSRDGLLSRAGTATVACFVHDPYTGHGLDAWTFASATVVGNSLVAKTVDGQEWRVEVDPATLRPTTPVVDRCTGAPGYSS
ncbi:hypothetical protein AB0J72_07285 [Dactylosporangium sp. NPDC049742]|uniref:hypothetical protein n=1 Tax=Dactylosporangium sp. NPDC049742 TaxID=3154737 RepID=UPI00341E9438